MNEPRLQDSTDYNGLRGNKRDVVYAIIGFLLALGVFYSIVKVQNAHVSDEIPLGKQMDHLR